MTDGVASAKQQPLLVIRHVPWEGPHTILDAFARFCADQTQTPAGNWTCVSRNELPDGSRKPESMP